MAMARDSTPIQKSTRDQLVLEKFFKCIDRIKIGTMRFPSRKGKTVYAYGDDSEAEDDLNRLKNPTMDDIFSEIQKCSKLGATPTNLDLTVSVSKIKKLLSEFSRRGESESGHWYLHPMDRWRHRVLKYESFHGWLVLRKDLPDFRSSSLVNAINEFHDSFDAFLGERQVEVFGVRVFRYVPPVEQQSTDDWKTIDMEKTTATALSKITQCIEMWKEIQAGPIAKLLEDPDPIVKTEYDPKAEAIKKSLDELKSDSLEWMLEIRALCLGCAVLRKEWEVLRLQLEQLAEESDSSGCSD